MPGEASTLQAGPASLASGVAASQAINLYFLGDVGGIADTASPALQREEAGSDYWRSALLTTFGVAEFLGGESLSATTLLDDAVAASERSHHSLALVHALGWCALVHAELGEPDRADQALADSEALQRREPGLPSYSGMSMTHVARGELLQRQDRLDEADEALTRGTELARRGNAKFDLSYALVIHAGAGRRTTRS